MGMNGKIIICGKIWISEYLSFDDAGGEIDKIPSRLSLMQNKLNIHFKQLPLLHLPITFHRRIAWTNSEATAGLLRNLQILETRMDRFSFWKIQFHLFECHARNYKARGWHSAIKFSSQRFVMKYILKKFPLIWMQGENSLKNEISLMDCPLTISLAICDRQSDCEGWQFDATRQ